VKNLALFGAIMTLASGTALADGSYTATLAQPVAAKTAFVVNNNMFRCDGSSCILVSTPVDALSVYTCRALQQKVGTLTAYAAFDAAKLARCNAPK
jgi:hypothetical protein